MKKLAAVLRLDFLPTNPSCGLLLLRLWLGLCIAGLHGWSKLTGFSSMHSRFPDPLGVGSTVSLSLAVLAEFVCGLLLVLGLFTRLAALILVINLTVAFVVVHKGKLVGPGSGELAFIYLAGYTAIMLAGAGKFSLDGLKGRGSDV